MSLIKTWMPHFQSSVRMRGREYQRAGRVKRQPAREGEIIRSEVQGSQKYTVVIKGEGSGATATCSCAFFAGGSYCKHIWAAILEASYNPSEPASDAEETGVAIEPDSIDDETVGAGQPKPGKARRRANDRKATRAAEPPWVGRLSLLRSAPVAAARPLGVADRLASASLATPPPVSSPWTLARQICYVLNPELTHRHQSLVVQLRYREPTQTGWSRLKRLRLQASQASDLPDPADRELVSLLLGASRLDPDGEAAPIWSEPANDTFRVPAGATRAMLRRMIATDRCLLADDMERESPVIWDDAGAWTLWIKGERSADEELTLDAELRRGEGVMMLDRPDLILGGVDGLLIAGGLASDFDDRGATRWVTQFRDDAKSRVDGATIVVPADDVPRFLERLYTLPHLPEIDLPTDLGRTERRVDPVPHLAIYSPSSQDGVLAAGVPKSQLLARVWFEYDRHRVKPGQEGRFIKDIEVDAEAESQADETKAKQSAATDDNANHDGAEEADSGEGEKTSRESDLIAAGLSLIRRDRPREEDRLAELSSVGFRHNPANGADTLLLAVRQMPNAVATLLQRGWSITADEKLIRRASPPRLSITSGIDWFELHGTVRFETAGGGQDVPLPELIAALRAGRNMVTLGDGSQGLLPEEWLAQHGLIAAMGKVEGDHLRFKSTQAALLDSLLDKAELVSVDEAFEASRRKLNEFKGIKAVDPLPDFGGQLRPYQREGLGWLAFLRWFGMGGVLADDMGLGKTVQVLAMLHQRYEKKVASDAAGANGNENPEHRPTLIVVPRSVVFNWIDEARHFAPNLRVQAYTGADRESLRDTFAHHDIVITSYGLMRRDIAELSKFKFELIVLDEAQAIKNPSSQSARAARLLQADHRLALTGTPVENHLGDLWSIFEFLNPGMLGSATNFGRLIRGEGAGSADDADAEAEAKMNGAAARDGTAAVRGPKASLDAAAATQISRALAPFILRRTKKQVLTELPEKTEQTLFCEMEPEQRALYDQLRAHYRQSLLGTSKKLFDGAGKTNDTHVASSGTMMVLEALLRLRQAACHPGLIDSKRQSEASAKMEVLLDRVADIIDEGHKALVFSQFTSLLALVKTRLDERGIVYEYLDGQTRDRRKRVHRFQSDPACPLFLISLKAGGLGLNLTAAGYVFILDPWWNPAVEAQAIDRAHRIGQSRHVFAYRLICRDTVEQRIIELQQKKKKLADAIVGGQENLLKSLTRDDLEKLLS